MTYETIKDKKRFLLQFYLVSSKNYKVKVVSKNFYIGR